MVDYSRKRFKRLKKCYPDNTIILSQDEECTCFSIYDDDAVYISEEIGGWPSYTKKGRCLVLDADEFFEDNLQPIPGEEGAFFFEPISFEFIPEQEEDEILPPSALARVTLTNGPDSKTCVIVSSAEDQDPKNQVFWACRADYARILYAIAENAPDVELGVKADAKGSMWHIVEYEKTDAFSGFVNHLDHFLNADDEPRTVFICEALPRSILEEVTAFFFTSDCATPVLMTVFYSPEDGEYYLDRSAYSVYRSKYGLPYVKLSLASKGITATFAKLAEQSELFLYGYSVSQKGGLTVAERHRLLAGLMDNGLMQKKKIENHISWLIKQNENNPYMGAAVLSWKDDIQFVNTYKMKHSKMIWAQSFAVKHKK